jgi:hypothetical protein
MGAFPTVPAALARPSSESGPAGHCKGEPARLPVGGEARALSLAACQRVARRPRAVMPAGDSEEPEPDSLPENKTGL